MTSKARFSFLVMLAACGSSGTTGDDGIDDGIIDPNQGVETGNALEIDLDQVSYSAIQILDATPRIVTLLGFDDALSESGGTLTITNGTGTGTASFVALSDAGGFTAEIEAAAGDELQLRYEKDTDDTTETLTLDDDLSTVTPPQLGTGSWIFIATPGEATVDLSSLIAFDLPVTVFNRDRAIAVTLDTPTGAIPADSGDTVCAFELVTTTASTMFCQPLP